MKTVQIGEVVNIGGNLYVVCSLYAHEDGIISAFGVLPFIGDPNNIDDINAALNISETG
jgi:hypothetical protein